MPAPSPGKALADVAKLSRESRSAPKTHQSGAKSEKHLEYEASIQEGSEDTFVNVKMQHSERRSRFRGGRTGE